MTGRVRAGTMKKLVLFTILLCMVSSIGAAQTSASFTSASLSQYRCIPDAWDPVEDSSEFTASVRENEPIIDVVGRPLHADILQRGQENAYWTETSVSTGTINGEEGLVFNIDVLNSNRSGSNVYCRALFDGVVEGAAQDFEGRTQVRITVRSNDTQNANLDNQRSWTVQIKLPGKSEPEGDDGPPGGGNGNGNGGSGDTVPPPGDVSPPDQNMLEKGGITVGRVIQIGAMLFALWQTVDSMTYQNLGSGANPPGYAEEPNPDDYDTTTQDGQVAYDQAQADYEAWEAKKADDGWMFTSTGNQKTNFRRGIETFGSTYGIICNSIGLVSSAVGLDINCGGSQQVSNYQMQAEGANSAYQETQDFANQASTSAQNSGCGFGEVLGSALLDEAQLNTATADQDAQLWAEVSSNPTSCFDPNRYCNAVYGGSPSGEGWIWESYQRQCVETTGDSSACAIHANIAGKTVTSTFSGPGKFWNARTNRCTFWSNEPCPVGEAKRPSSSSTFATASCVEVNAHECSDQPGDRFMWTPTGRQCVSHYPGESSNVQSCLDRPGDDRTIASNISSLTITGLEYGCIDAYNFPDCPPGYTYNGVSCIVGN